MESDNEVTQTEIDLDDLEQKEKEFTKDQMTTIIDTSAEKLPIVIEID